MRSRVCTVVAAALAAGALMVLAAPPAWSATLTVNSEGDERDALLDDVPSVCDTQLAVAGEQCTLRAALEEANYEDGADTISFNIPGAGVHTISPRSRLPGVGSAVTIDGYTQPGASPNTRAFGEGDDAVLLIELNGANAGSETSGLEIAGSNIVVRGLVINRFGGVGIEFIVFISGTGQRFEGNFIGTDPSGTIDRGNAGGIAVYSLFDPQQERNSVIGGTSPAARNVISGNRHDGVLLEGGGSVVQGNYIGTERDGTSALGNGWGVVINFGFDSTVGGEDGPNVIAFNEFDGISVRHKHSLRDRLSRNRIFSNGDLGIDLIGEGVTPNDKRDRDGGPNLLQNFPVLESAITAAGETTVKGKLKSRPNSAYTLEFFSNPSGKEGYQFIGDLDVQTNGEGKAFFTFDPDDPVAPGRKITATATDESGNTSEFSAPRKVITP